LKSGEPIAASLQHAVFYPEKTCQNYSTIVTIHGRGADAYDLLPVVESLGIDDALVIAPRAPRPYGQSGGYTWYDLKEKGIPDAKTFNESLILLRKFLQEVKKGYPIDPARLILLGFSQGSVMSYAVGLLDPKSVRGIVALSGYIPHRSGLPFEWSKVANLPVFVSHGTYDELISLSLAHESAELLRKAGAGLAYNEYAMGHEVREETLRDLALWMRRVLGESGPI
jgi:phospholipase/carboxylesterase